MLIHLQPINELMNRNPISNNTRLSAGNIFYAVMVTFALWPVGLQAGSDTDFGWFLLFFTWEFIKCIQIHQ